MQVLSPVTAAGPLPILTGFPVRPKRAPQHKRMIAQYDPPVKQTFGNETAWAGGLFPPTWLPASDSDHIQKHCKIVGNI